MNAVDELLKLYQRWGALSESEGQAIRSGDWAQVAEVQREKERLQNEIRRKTSALNQAETGGASPEAVRDRINGVLHNLIVQERQNQEALAEQRRLADAQMTECRAAGRNLRQLHKAYAMDRASTWQSYS